MVSGLAMPALADVFALVETSPDPEQKQAAESGPPMTAQTEDGLIVEVVLGEDVTNIPEGSHVDVAPLSEVESEEYEKLGAAVLNGKVAQSRFVDITILDPDGQSVEPNGKVKVSLNAPDAAPEGSTMHVVHFKDPAASAPSEDEENDLNAELPIEEKAEPQPEPKKGLLSKSGLRAESITLDKEENGIASLVRGDAVSDGVTIPSDDPVVTDGEEQLSEEENEFIIEEITDYQVTKEGTILFETDSFSVFGIIYTVDFHWNVEGQSFEYSIPGGGFISLTELLTILQVADDIPAFVAEIENVAFSNPELVWIGKTDEETTVGNIKSANELNCQYSEDLSTEQIEDIDAQVVNSGDWALISLVPFETEETLTVTMKDGEQFVIKVTDAAYTGTAVDVSNLDGKTGALVRTRSNLVNAVLDTALNSNHLAAVGVTIDGNKIKTTDTPITQWTFTKVEGETDRYYITSPKGYLNIGAGSATVTTTPQALQVQTSGNEIRIKRTQDEYALNNDSNQTSSGYSSWSGSSYTNQNQGEWFTVYSLEEVFPVTLHFVKEGGVSFNQGEVFYADGTPVEIINGDWYINEDKLVVGSDGIIDLKQFKVKDSSGKEYTLDNTHKSTYEDMDGTDFSGTSINYPHAIIGNELRLHNGTLQYKLYYVNEDKAGWYWFDVGTEPTRDTEHWFNYQWTTSVSDTNTYCYTDPYERGSTDQEADNAPKPYDYFLVYSPIPTENTSSGGSQTPGLNIGEVDKSKTLNYNNDGTYTMELGVTTKAAGNTEKNGVNIIVVFDTSSSMQRRTVDPVQHYVREEWYEEWPKVDPWSSTTQYYDKSRAVLTQNALSNFLDDLYSGVENRDDIQLALIDFNYTANSPKIFGGSNWTSNTTAFMNEVKGLSYHSGTNWADGLKKAMELSPPNNNTNPTYVLLMTDGAPSQYWHSGVDGMFVSGGACSLGAMDEARAVVNGGRELYGIFSFGTEEDEDNGYLSNLVDYAYNKSVPDHSTYAQNDQQLVSALNAIMQVVKKNVAHTGVNYHDGIALDTTSTALNVNVGGNLGSITYSKTGGTTPSYTVVANSDGTIQSFTVDGVDHTANARTTSISHKKISGSGNTITTTTVNSPVYQCTVGSGTDAKTYNMPIATLSIDEDTKVGDLNWDLSPLGLMENGATYTISFVVWPDQKAYDYVSDLNNGKMQWGVETTPAPVYADDGTTVLYYKNGVKDYPNIVYYPDTNTYAVLTNTTQDVTYYTETDESLGPDNLPPHYEGPFTVDPKTPDPMPLRASKSKIEKQWNVDRNPAVLRELLYGNKDENGNWVPFSITFDVKIDDTGSESTTPTEPTEQTGDSNDPTTTTDSTENIYTSVTLGWQRGWKVESHDEAEWDHDYIWEDAPEEDNVRYPEPNGKGHKVGTRWAVDFSIATGLMLSDAKMTERGLDKNSEKYKCVTCGNENYYILEEGHDYYLEETPKLSYNFDPPETRFHPMIVDGKLQSVTFTRDEEGNITGIESVTNYADGLASLKVENTLRGYLYLNKIVHDENGTEIDDETKFSYHIKLENPSPVFEGDHIPWYGVNDLFYHDEDFNYYQAYLDDNHKLKVYDEASDREQPPYDADIGVLDPETGEFTPQADSTFDENKVTGQTISYNGKIVTIFGNRTNAAEDGKSTQADLEINKDEHLSIANVPLGTTYTITELIADGYELEKIESNQAFRRDGRSISGQIVQNADNIITYTNKVLIGSLKLTKIVKVDGNTPIASQYKLVDGNYTFKITGPTSVDEEDRITRYVQIGVENGKAAKYRMASSQDDLETADWVDGEIALVPNLAKGDYIVEEIGTNGLTLYSVARGDGDSTAVDEYMKVTLTVTEGEDNPEETSEAMAIFTNNKDRDQDEITIDMQKTFVGLESQSDIPAGFKAELHYKIGDDPHSIELTGTSSGNVTVTKSDDGLTWNWHVTHIDRNATDFTVTESNYDKASGYTWVLTKINGQPVANPSVPSTTIQVQVPQIRMTDVTRYRITPDIMNSFTLLEGDVLIVALTEGAGTLVVSLDSLGMATRSAIVNVLMSWHPGHQGNFQVEDADHVYFLSREMNPEGFTFKGKDINFEDGNRITFDPNQTSQKQVHAVSFKTGYDENSFTLENDYVRNTSVPLEAIKRMKGGEDPGEYSFTLTAVNGAPMPDKADGSGRETSPLTRVNLTEGTNIGSISFGSIVFTANDLREAPLVAGSQTVKEKTFTYTVSEIAGSDPNIRYDASTYTVSIKVTYDTAAGTLTADDPVITKTLEGHNIPADAIVFENEKVTETGVTKAWVNSNGNQPPEDARITLTLYKQVTAVTEDPDNPGSTITSTTEIEVGTVVLNGLADLSSGTPGEGQETLAASGNNANAYEDTAWHAKWTNLPKYENGQLISYIVKETGGESGYVVSYSTDGTATYAVSGGTVTNTQTEIEVTKVWLTNNIGNGVQMEWPEGVANITLTLERGDSSDNFALKVTAPRPTGDTPVDAVISTVTGKTPTEIRGITGSVSKVTDEDGKVTYTIKVRGVEAGYTYRFTESDVPGYTTGYAVSGINADMSKTTANEREIIINSVISAELPQTGSNHAKVLSIIGTTALMIAGAGYMLATHKKKEY